MTRELTKQVREVIKSELARIEEDYEVALLTADHTAELVADKIGQRCESDPYNNCFQIIYDFRTKSITNNWEMTDFVNGVVSMFLKGGKNV